MNKTTNYQLNQWVKDDQVRMEDFNADNAKIDAAIKAEANARAAGDAALSARVDSVSAAVPKVKVGTYNPGDLAEGTPYHVSVGFRPKAVLAWHNNVTRFNEGIMYLAFAVDGHPVQVPNSNQVLLAIEDGGFYVQWYRATDNSNYFPYLAGGLTYNYLAIG